MLHKHSKNVYDDINPGIAGKNTFYEGRLRKGIWFLTRIWFWLDYDLVRATFRALVTFFDADWDYYDLL